VDRAFENVINIAFYFILGFAVLSQLGVNPTALFVAMSTNIVAFAFIIGPAMSKMFEGWLFILLQRPYDIGDRIHVSNVQQDTNADGNPSWIVKVR
jgi:small-conductance mechanosensitive channel